LATLALAVWAVCTALEATVAASWALPAMDWMVEVISSAPEDTLCRFWLTCWEA